MSRDLAQRVERVLRFLQAGQRLADAADPLGTRARELLPRSTGLSAEGVVHALEHCLERCPAPAELERLVADTPRAPRAHVSLPANVFTAPLRAIALALAASPRVFVRASRREPVMTRLLSEASSGQFECVDELRPEPGEPVWAYGSDQTLGRIEGKLPAGVLLHGHGFGFGLGLLDEVGLATATQGAEQLARDVIAFDQRGCLSPRVVLVKAPLPAVHAFADELAAALSSLQAQVPLGKLDPGECADVIRFRETMTFASERCLDLGPAGSIAVLEDAGRLVIPPVGRQVLVVCHARPLEQAAKLAPQLTQLGVACAKELECELGRALPDARVTSLGTMQCPPLDGPADRRARARVL